jgi:hypothetical protein
MVFVTYNTEFRSRQKGCVAITPSTFIREVLGSSLGWDIGVDFFCFSRQLT